MHFKACLGKSKEKPDTNSSIPNRCYSGASNLYVPALCDIRTKKKSIQVAGRIVIINMGLWPVILKTNGVKIHF